MKTDAAWETEQATLPGVPEARSCASGTDIARPASRCMARSLAVLAVSWAAACGGDGVTEPEPPAQPNRSPVAVVPQAPPQAVELGDTIALNVALFFSDPDGDALTYTASSSDRLVVTVSMTGSTATAVAVAVGTAMLTVTATDPDELSASLSVMVAVAPAAAPSPVRR